MKPKPGRKWKHPKPVPDWLRQKDEKKNEKTEAKPPPKDK